MMGVVGPAVAGLLIGITSVGGVFATHAATYLTSALCLLGLRLRRGPRPSKRERFRTDLVEGWREFRARGWVWGVILVWMVLMITTFGPLTALVATEIITAHGDTAYGLVNSVGGAVTAVAGMAALLLGPPVRDLDRGKGNWWGLMWRPGARSRGVGAGERLTACAPNCSPCPANRNARTRTLRRCRREEPRWCWMG